MKKQSGEMPALGIQILDEELAKRKELLENYVYSCSHAIRSPLKTMEGLVKLMKDHPQAETEWQQCRSLLQQSATKMQSILCHFHALSCDTPTSAPQLIKLSPMVDRVLATWDEFIAKYGVSTSVRIIQKGDLYGDQKQLETVLSEIVANAIIFYDPEKKERKVSIFVTSSPSSCSIQVHDNGTGISPDIIAAIFNLFFRGTARSIGTGMGLFTAKQLLKRMGGTIAVESEVDKGSIFSIWIPNYTI